MADMTHTRLELCNMIRMEAEHTKDTGFPLEVFPQTVQSVILDMVRYENYKTEFIATAMISAASAALGGTYRIRIKGEWQSNAALYIILVGRPGLGKTPPLEAAYRPIRKHDYALFKAYEAGLEAWKADRENGKKPVLRRTVVSDFTPESLLLTHNNNPRSVVILVDEIMGMFNSANRYTNGQLIEQLLTAWSGGALDVTRVSSTIPIHIEQPCINIVGTTQTKRVHELLTKDSRITDCLTASCSCCPSPGKCQNGLIGMMAGRTGYLWQRHAGSRYLARYSPWTMTRERKKGGPMCCLWTRRQKSISSHGGTRKWNASTG